MDKQPHFRSILPAHAIERCGAAVIFDQPLPSKPFEREILAFKGRVKAFRLRPAPASMNITVDTAKGSVSVNPDGTNSAYTSVDGASSLLITPQMIAWHTARYIRWAPFRGDVDRVMLPLLHAFLEVVSIAAVKLEYWDRFIWTGKLPEFDPALLIRPDSQLVALHALRKGTYWHSHCGWFDKSDDEARRLVNVNLDAVEYMQPNRPTAPSIGIYTMMQEDARPKDGCNGTEIVTTIMDDLHISLKQLFASIINDEFAQRISLNAEKQS